MAPGELPVQPRLVATLALREMVPVLVMLPLSAVMKTARHPVQVAQTVVMPQTKMRVKTMKSRPRPPGSSRPRKVKLALLTRRMAGQSKPRTATW